MKILTFVSIITVTIFLQADSMAVFSLFSKVKSTTSNLPPGKGKWPLFGDTFKLINEKTMATYQTDSRLKYGDIWKTSLFFKPAVFITGSENLKFIFTEEAKKKTQAFFPPHHKKLFGENSLLVQSGPYHAKLRRIIQLSLSPPAIAQMDEVILTKIRGFVNDCKTETNSFKFVDKIRSFFIKLAVSVLLGNDIKDKDLEALASDISVWSKGLLSAPITFIPWSIASRAMRARKRISKKLLKYIESYKSNPAPSQQNNLLHRLVTTKDDIDGENLSADAIVDNIFTLIFAGSDTTASSVTSAIKILSEQPMLETKLRSLEWEINDATLDYFITQVLNKNPPAPFSMRLVEDQPLVIGEYKIPPNWLVAYGYAGTLLGESSSDTLISLDAVTSVDRADKADKHAAFGGGPRMCPGRYLALKELKLLLSEILGINGFKWKLEKDQNLQQVYSPGYFPVDGLKLRVIREA